MANGVIVPTAVYPPSGRGRYYQTYNTRTVPNTPPPPQTQTTPASGFNYSRGRLFNLMQNSPGGTIRVSVPNGVPAFLGTRTIILMAWALSMTMVSLDEWHTYHILPRPARLWYTSLTYFLLALVATIDATVPIVNLFAIGYTIAVAYNYYQGTGGFGGFGKNEGNPK